MKYIVTANNVGHLKMLMDIGITNVIVSSEFSSYRKGFSLDEIKECFEILPTVIVSFYDLISESKIEDAVSLVEALVEIGIKNFVVNDLGIIYYLKQFDVNIIYDNITVNTNYESVNILGESGINSVVLGREITLEEINEISSKSTIPTIVHVQGMFPIFTSIRKLVSNYKQAKDVNIESDNYYLLQKERAAKYPIIENDNGVVMFSSYEQCSIEDIGSLQASAFLIDQPHISNEDSIEIVKMYLDYKKYSIKDIENVCENKQSRGFFFKKTMYKL